MMTHRPALVRNKTERGRAARRHVVHTKAPGAARQCMRPPRSMAGAASAFAVAAVLPRIQLHVEAAPDDHHVVACCTRRLRSSFYGFEEIVDIRPCYSWRHERSQCCLGHPDTTMTGAHAARATNAQQASAAHLEHGRSLSVIGSL